MKTAIIGALALTLAATPAFGQSASSEAAVSRDFAVSGSINARCTAGTATPLSFGAIDLNDNGTLAANQSESTTLAIYCNGANTKLKVAGSSINNTSVAGTAPDGFTKTLALATTATIGSVTASLSSPADGVLLGAVAGDLTVSTGELSASARPMAGDYAGTITVTLTPGV
jgi:spore coat protein U-like protein